MKPHAVQAIEIDTEFTEYAETNKHTASVTAYRKARLVELVGRAPDSRSPVQPLGDPRNLAQTSETIIDERTLLVRRRVA